MHIPAFGAGMPPRPLRRGLVTREANPTNQGGFSEERAFSRILEHAQLSDYATLIRPTRQGGGTARRRTVEEEGNESSDSASLPSCALLEVSILCYRKSS